MTQDGADDLIENENRGLIITGPKAIERAQEYGAQLKRVIKQQGMYTTIGKKDHVHVEGWGCLGAMMGIYSDITKYERVDKNNTIEVYLVEMEKVDKYKKTKEIVEKFIRTAMYNKKTMKIVKDEDGNEKRQVEEIKYMAECSLYTAEGKFIGKAVSMCSNLEEGKWDKPEYAIMSMAQTRATGKRYRLSFSWIMSMAGYDPTVPEEMEDVHGTVLEAETVPGKEEAEVLGDTPTEEVHKEEAPAPTPDPKPKKEVKKYAPKIPKETDELKKLYPEVKEKANSLGIKASEVLVAIGEEMPITSAKLPKLIPAIVEAINAKLAEAAQ